MDLKFVHASDLHLDSPLRGLPLPPGRPELEDRVRRATFHAFARIVDLCLRESVAFLLLGGDLFDQKDRSVRARLFLRRQLERLDAKGIRTFIVHGNHDPLSGDRALELPASVKVFGAEHEEVVVRDGERVRYRVQGISYPEERVTHDLSRFFSRQGPELTIGLLHANVGGDAGHAPYAPCSTADLARAGIDYWALGHVHTRAEFELERGVAVYPGNPQGRHPNELGPRGCVLVRASEGGLSRTFVPVDGVRWHEVPVSIAGLTGLEQLVAAIEAAVEEACLPGFDAHAVRVRLTGRGPLHRELRAEGLGQLEAELREVLVARPTPVLVESVIGDTSPEIDLSPAALEGSLQGTVHALGAMPPGLAEELFGSEELKRLESLYRKHQLGSVRTDAAKLWQQGVTRALELLQEDGR